MKKKLKLIIIFSILIIIILFICFVPLIWEGYSGSESAVSYDPNEFGKETLGQGYDDYENDCYDCRVTIEGVHKVGMMKFEIYYLKGTKEKLVKSFDVDITDYFKEVIKIPHISEKKGKVHTIERYTIDSENSYKVKMEKRYTILQFIIKKIKYIIEDIKENINGTEGVEYEKNTLPR